MIAVPAAHGRQRSESEAPIVTLKSSIFETYGSANQFHLLIGGREGAYIDVDCGFGPVEVELKPAKIENGALTGTYVTCAVNSAGTVKIYGNPADIDYFEAEGCYLRSADISQLTELTGVDFDHNELTALDLTPHTKLQSISVSDNPFSAESPLIIGANKPELMILDMSITKWIDPSFNLSAYPAMASFDAYACETLNSLDPSGCPNLMRLTADVTPLQSLDVTQNAKLQILNVADTRITSIDLSGCPILTQFYCNHDGHQYGSYKFSSLDVTHNPKLIYLFCGGNNLTSLDLSQNPQLMDLSAVHNNLTAIDLSNNGLLINVNIANNDMGFANLPLNPGVWNEYYYQQKPTTVRRSYKVGDVIDLSAKMLREGTVTTGVLMKKNEEDFSVPLPVDPSLYTWTNDGKLSLNAEITDSVFVSYTNDRFEEATLTTTHFVVKTADKFGLDNTAITLLPASDEGTPVSFRVRVAGTPSVKGVSSAPKFDFGNGIPTAIESLTVSDDGYYHVSLPRNGLGYTKIILPEGMDVTGFAIEGQELYSLNISGAPVLRDLTVKGAGLYGFDLTKHRCLESLCLQGNNLSMFSLKAKNFNFAKTMLTNLDLSGNSIATFEFDGLEGIRNIDLSRNNLTELELGTANMAEYINISHNKLAEVNLLKCDAIRNIDFSNNLVTNIIMPEVTTPASMNVASNRLTPSTLPAPSLFTGTYTYAPQAPVTIAPKGPGVNLSSLLCTVGGYTTSFSWFKADGTPLVEGTDYTVTQGTTRFLKSDLGKVYCQVSHGAFPAFTSSDALLTSQILVTPMPNNVVANFTTTADGQVPRVALAAASQGTMVMFDWKGDGSSMDMYELGTTYSEFYPTTTAGANVKVYAYEDGAPLTVFSIMGASMSDIDLSKLTHASTINVGQAGLTNISLPAPGKLTELFLDGNKLTNGFDLSAYKQIYYLSLNDNLFEGQFDFSVLPNLQIVSVAANKLTSAKFANPLLWGLDLARNQFESIDFSGATGLEQIALSGNKLSTLDISALHGLKSLMIDRNRFTFSTLPPVDSITIHYIYGNQAALDIVPQGLTVDLASEATALSQPTTYRWFIDEISKDEEGNIVGEELVADEEYTLQGGVTTFASPFQRLIGVLTNPAFPDLTLVTNMFDISAAGVDDTASATPATVSVSGHTVTVTASEPTAVRIFNVSGQQLNSLKVASGTTPIATLNPGCYIILTNSTPHKVVVR